MAVTKENMVIPNMDGLSRSVQEVLSDFFAKEERKDRVGTKTKAEYTSRLVRVEKVQAMRDLGWKVIPYGKGSDHQLTYMQKKIK